MEEKTTPISPPENTTPPSVTPPTIPSSPKKSKLVYVAIALFIVLVLTILASVYANLFLSKKTSTSPSHPQPTPTSRPLPTPTPDPQLKGLKVVETSFATLTVPNDWDLWDCGNDYYVLFKNNPQPTQFAKSCPFGGNAGEMQLGKVGHPPATLEKAVPKTNTMTNDGSDGSEPYTFTQTVSNQNYSKIDGRDAAQWKEVLTGGLMGAGTYQRAFIMPNITITLMNYDNLPVFEEILSSIKFKD